MRVGPVHEETVCYRARMSWILPTPLLLFAEAFAATLAVIAAVWLAWVALWLIEQRW